MVQLEYTIKDGKIYAAGTHDFGESFLEGTGGDLSIVGAPGSSRTWVARSIFPSLTRRPSRTRSTCSREPDRTVLGADTAPIRPARFPVLA